MKRYIKSVLTAIFCFILIFAFAGCGSSSSVKDPKDAIKDAYGGTQFKITFDSSDLSSPLSDIYYSANNMPVLPSPEKVGYVFAGWYFDSALTNPCDVSNGDLYWKMCNLTLYPKWEKEAIVNNGTYALDYEAKIVDGSVVKGILADTYGWHNFAEDIIADETYIEKNEQGTFLRIQYNCHERGPIFADSEDATFEVQAYTVEDPENRVNESLSILDRTSLIQTIYYDISGLNIADPIYLNVTYYNWAADVETREERDRCSVAYKVEFKITRFIGFSKSFVNTDGKLDNGVYMVPTHYTGLDKGQAMLDYFHPVYAYIIAENGHYTLIKPLSAYNSDILGNLSGDDYFNRTTGFARDFTYFLTDKSNTITSEQKENYNLYIPSLLKAKSWGNLTYEFHADTGRYYYTFDLGDSLSNDIILFGGSTGAMEQMFNFPFSYRRLTLSYDSMVRITDWDYTPVSGDSFTYRKQMPLYAGYTQADFTENNADFDVMQRYAMSVRMVNMFFASNDGGKTGTKNFDSKMTIAPTAQTAAGNLSDMRYSFSYFDLTYEAFGYDPKTDGELYSAATNFLAAFTPLAGTNFTIEKTDIGKTVNEGDTVDLVSLYTEIVYPSVNASGLSWQAYSLDKDGEADFSKPVSLSRSFAFSEGVAVYYSAKYDDVTRNCLVTIMPYEKPQNVTVASSDWHYDDSDGIYKTDKRFKVGNYVEVPEVTWSWLGDKYTSFTLTKYDDEVPYTNFLNVAAYVYENGVYNKAFSQFTDLNGTYNITTMLAPVMRVEFRLYNRFGEFTSLWLEYRGEAAGDYGLFEKEKIVSSGDLKYEKKEDGSETRAAITYTENSAKVIKDLENLLNVPAEYSLRVTDSDVTSVISVPLITCNVYTKNAAVTAKNFEEAWAIIKDEKYAMLELTYRDEYGDSVKLNVMYGFTVDGASLYDYKIVSGASTLFTGEEMSFERPKIAGADYVPFARGGFKVYRKNGDNYKIAEDEEALVESGSYGATLKFLQEGEYRLAWYFGLNKDFNGKPIFTVGSFEMHSLQCEYSQDVIVYDRNTDIEVTYVTDVSHPFDSSKIDYVERDGYQYYTTTVSMAKSNLSLDYSSFVATSDRLWGWSSSLSGDDRLFSAGSSIGRLGITLGTVTPTVYALWDEGIVVKAYYDVDGDDTKLLGEVKYYRPTSGGNYTFSLFDFRQFYEFKQYSDYEVAYWKADKAIFETREGIVYTYSDVFECGSTDKAFENGWKIEEAITLRAVLKKKLNVSYLAIDEKENPLAFTSQPGSDRACLEGFTLSSKITQAKLKMLQSVSCTDSSKEFKYWAVKIDGVLTKIDIENTKLEQNFATKNAQTGKYNSVVVLYAVFGDKEA